MSTLGATVGAPSTRAATWRGGTCHGCCERSLIQLVVRRPVADRGYGASNSPRRIAHPHHRIKIIRELERLPILPILQTMFSVENLSAGRGQRGRAFPAWAGAWRDDPAGPGSPRVRRSKGRPSEYRTSQASPMCGGTASRCSAGTMWAKRYPSVTLPRPSASHQSRFRPSRLGG
ncbi:MAG: hypothetical protein QOJ58_2100 [Alphaproteobacteria bacterium]|jgi:hypothetical protein|nr:hypothetical protein [Alphaproteobacteria bacterium]